jgi:hypothetical protein
MLIEATRELRQANIVLEAHRQGVQDIQEEIAKLEAIINKPDRWQDRLVQPEKEEYYYLISSKHEGLIVGLHSETDKRPEHAFRTKEQAELIKDKMLLMQEMYAFAHVKNEGWMPDWEDNGRKFGITQGGGEIEVDRFDYLNSFVFGIAVKSMEIAEEMLEIFGERIEKFYNKMH